MNKSPIANFIEVLNRVKDDATHYSDQLTHNEAQTRITLIDPILRGLGWDLSNPNMIGVELVYQNVRADYALVNSTGQTKVVIEAKKLGTRLNNLNNDGTAFNYAFRMRVPHAVIADGLRWYFYDDFTPERQDPVKYDLNQGPLHEIALELITRLDAANFGYYENTLTDQEEPAQLVHPHNIAPVPRNFQLFEELPNNLTGHPRPTLIRLPDSHEIAINGWGGALFEIAKFVLDRTPNIQIPLVDAASEGTNLLGWDEPNGRTKRYEFKERNLFVYVNYDANNCIRNAKYLLSNLSSRLIQNPPALGFD